MQQRPPVSFTDRQILMVQKAAKAIPHDQREMFLAALAASLTGEVSDHAVSVALNVQMNRLVPAYLEPSNK